MLTAEIIETVENAVARIQREAAPTQGAAGQMLEKQRGILRDLELAVEDAVDDMHVRRRLTQRIDDADDAVETLLGIIDSIYAREAFQELRTLAIDLRLEQRMGRAWTEGPDSRPPNPSPRPRLGTFGFSWAAFGREFSLSLSATVSRQD